MSIAQRGEVIAAPIDPVTAAVVRSALETICFEMATYVSRTATTPILNQSNERNATILTGDGRLAALSVGIPQFMLSSTLPVRFAAEFFDGDLHPGDVIVANDPYHGGGHLPDFNVFSPVFGPDGRLLLFASIQCHHGDTGGAMAGGYNVFAKDIWSEGTRYPLLKILDRGIERRDVVLTMRANNRLPGFIGDLGLFAGWQVTPNFSLKVGYDFLWVAGIATATRQFNLNNIRPNSIDGGGQILYNGLSLGCDGSW